MSGSASERVAVVTAGARSLPALKYSIDEGMPAHGPIRSAVACGGSRVVGTERGRIFMLQAPTAKSVRRTATTNHVMALRDIRGAVAGLVGIRVA